MQSWSFRVRFFQIMQFGWLMGLALCLSTMAAWAQAPDFGLPSPGGENAGFPFGGSEGVLGEGDRAAKFEAGFTTPGPDRAAQLFIIATLPPGAHTYSITQPHGGPLATKIKVSPPQGVLTIGAFQSVKPPRIEHDEDAFPGLPLETHTGTVKWVAPVQFADDAKPETLKIEGKVNVQLCDAKGCAAEGLSDYCDAASQRPGGED